MRLYNNTHYKATLIQFKLHTVIVTFWTKKKKKKRLCFIGTSPICFFQHFKNTFAFLQPTSTLSPHQWSVIRPYIIFERNLLERCITFRSCCNNHTQHRLNFLRNKRKCLRSITGFETLSRQHTCETASFRRQACLTLMLNVKYPIYVQQGAQQRGVVILPS